MLGTAKSLCQGPSKEGDGGCKMRCLDQQGLGLCRGRENPKSLNPPEMIQVQVASVSEMNTKQQNNRGNLACETKVFRIFTQFP